MYWWATYFSPGGGTEDPYCLTVRLLFNLIYSINFQASDSFYLANLILTSKWFKINYLSKTPGKLVVEFNVTKEREREEKKTCKKLSVVESNVIEMQALQDENRVCGLKSAPCAGWRQRCVCERLRQLLHNLSLECFELRAVVGPWDCSRLGLLLHQSVHWVSCVDHQTGWSEFPLYWSPLTFLGFQEPFRFGLENTSFSSRLSSFCVRHLWLYFLGNQEL